METIRNGTTWTMLSERMFETLDTNASGSITKDEIEYSVLSKALMKHWTQLKKKKKNGNVTKKQWNKWFESIKKNVFEGDEEKMQTFCASLVYDADIDVSDLIVVATTKDTKVNPNAAAVDAKTIEDNEVRLGITRHVLSLIGNAYLGAKDKLDGKLPETAVSKLTALEKVIDARYASVADAIDDRISGTVDYVKTSARRQIDTLADTTSKRVDEISNRPVVKDLVAPVACAVVDGLLGAGDVIVDYALPDAESIVDTSVATKRSEDDQKIVVPHAKKLVSKLGKRLYKRAEGGMSAIEERKEQLRKVKVDLIAYAKGFLGQQKMLLERAAANPKKMTAEKLKSLHEFANAVMEPYRQNIKGKWNDNVQPMFLAVTDYGEYFMEHVSEYEKSSKIDGADVVPSPSTDSDVNRFISRVAHRFIEPTLVRTVAVFMVLGDEMRRLKVQAIEPNVAIAEKKVREAVSEAQRVVKDVVTKMNGRYSAGLKRFDGELVKFEEFKQKLAVHVRQEFDAIVQPVQNKIFAAIQSLPWSGSQPVTLEDFRKTVAEKVGSEYVKYEKYLKPLVQNIHRAIVVAEEWATPWVDAAKDAWTVEATTSHSK